MARERRYVSPGLVAEALGVGETTVKRWVDEERLPARRTAGGHRKILVEDVLRLVREEHWPHVNLELLAGGSCVLIEACELAEPFHEALLSGSHEATRGAPQRARLAGLSWAVVADGIVAPVMARVGECWATGDIDVFEEHWATQVCLAALLAHKARLEPAAEDAALAVGGGPEGDHYMLANVLIEMTLLELGWRVVNIGPNTPPGSFRAALRELKPRLMWLSCSHLADVESFLAGYAVFWSEAAAAGVAVSVGGRSLDEPVRSRLAYTHHGDRLVNLAAYARDLYPGTRPPG